MTNPTSPTSPTSTPKQPPKVHTFTDEILGTSNYIHERFSNEAKLHEIAIYSSNEKSKCTRLVFQLNSLRKSLQYWASDINYSPSDRAILFNWYMHMEDYKFLIRQHGQDNWQVVVEHKRRLEDLGLREQIPDLERQIDKLQIPREIERRKRRKSDKVEEKIVNENEVEKVAEEIVGDESMSSDRDSEYMLQLFDYSYSD